MMVTLYIVSIENMNMRNLFFSLLMPRFSYVVGQDFFLPAMKMKALGKTEFKIGKITVKG